MSAEFPDGIEESWRADAAEQEVRRLRAALEKIYDIYEESDCVYAALDQISAVAHNALNGHE
jgi:hypothetical protein